MNKFGTAPGMWIENNGKTFVSLPGVPYEMKALIKNEVIPALRSKYQFPYIKHKNTSYLWSWEKVLLLAVLKLGKMHPTRLYKVGLSSKFRKSKIAPVREING